MILTCIGTISILSPDDERLMLACDHCDDWFHAICMHIEEEDVELVDSFICPSCTSRTY